MLFSAVTAVVIKRLPPGHPVTANAPIIDGRRVTPLALEGSGGDRETDALGGRLAMRR
jgi:hypothetical protein